MERGKTEEEREWEREEEREKGGERERETGAREKGIDGKTADQGCIYWGCECRAVGCGMVGESARCCC